MSGEFNAFPNIAKKVIRWLSGRQLILQPFFLALFKPGPRVNLSLPHDDPRILLPFVRSLLLPPSLLVDQSSLLSTSPINCGSIQEYKALPILLPACTILYRALHKKIPTRSLLHQMNPSQYPSPHCLRCLAHGDTLVETFSLFMFTCPRLSTVWKTIFTQCLSPNITDAQLESFLLLIFYCKGNNPRLYLLYRVLSLASGL
ncbi:hypothetical protein BDB01DRAFT_809361 [Pilobolus umbonatus]|nr:hypothetical protein BDB01DRAFT_809361 [Pilobolus umbonatus]